MATFISTPSRVYSGLTLPQLTTILTAAGLQATDFRPPQRGERYLTAPGREIQTAGNDKADPRLILGPLAAHPQQVPPEAPGTLTMTAAESYNGQVPATPEGYRKADFRFNAPGEIVLQADGRARPAQTRLNVPFFILEALPPAVAAQPVAAGVWQ